MIIYITYPAGPQLPQHIKQDIKHDMKAKGPGIHILRCVTPLGSLTENYIMLPQRGPTP